MQNGARANILGSPSGAQDEPWGENISPRRPLDPVFAEIRRSLEQDKVVGGVGPEGRWITSGAVSDMAADIGGPGRDVDPSITGAALAVAAVVLRPGVARWVGDRVREFYCWYTAHTKCRWCINVSSVVVTALLLLMA